MSDREQVVATPHHRAMTPELPGTLRAVALGSALGVVLAFVGVAGMLSATGNGTPTALGVGAMAAFWGGLGFGSMLGGTLHLVRELDRPRERPEPVVAPSEAARSNAQAA